MSCGTLSQSVCHLHDLLRQPTLIHFLHNSQNSELIRDSGILMRDAFPSLRNTINLYWLIAERLVPALEVAAEKVQKDLKSQR